MPCRYPRGPRTSLPSQRSRRMARRARAGRRIREGRLMLADRGLTSAPSATSRCDELPGCGSGLRHDSGMTTGESDACWRPGRARTTRQALKRKMETVLPVAAYPKIPGYTSGHVKVTNIGTDGWEFLAQKNHPDAGGSIFSPSSTIRRGASCLWCPRRFRMTLLARIGHMAG